MSSAPAEPGASAVERAVRRDRAVLLGGIAALAALAWVYLAGMGGMTVAPDAGAWSAGQLVALFVMWTVMMVAMMLPSAAPMILMFARVRRRRSEQGRAAVPTAVFVAGYLLVWTAWAAAAAAAQGALHQAALLTPAMASATPFLGGSLLVAAGIYQWTPLKHACLRGCRSTLGFLTSEWREGTRGALVMGIRHGHYCVGCCWTLMALLFVAGVMNLFWIALLAALVLVEKVAPAGDRIGRVTGVGLVAWGVWLLAGAVV